MNGQRIDRKDSGLIDRPVWYRYRYSLRSLLLALSVAMLVIAAYALGYQHGIIAGRFIDKVADQPSEK